MVLIKDLPTHYVIATRVSLLTVAIPSASCLHLSPGHPIEHIFIALSGLGLLLSKLAPHTWAFPLQLLVPRHMQEPSGILLLLLFSFLCILSGSPEAASREMAVRWHGHLVPVTAQYLPLISPSSIFSTHHRRSALSAHFG